jgi:hypothetical protein
VIRDLADAEHEAAHIVVGVTLGLRLRYARLYKAEHDAEHWELGATLFADSRSQLSQAIMHAAGIAWERRRGGRADYATADRATVLGLLKTPADVRAATQVAREILRTRRRIHERVARELWQRDLSHRDIRSLVLG